MIKNNTKTHIKIFHKNATIYFPVALKDRWEDLKPILARLNNYALRYNLVALTPSCPKCKQVVGIWPKDINLCTCPKSAKVKYNNKRIKLGELILDSKAEARRYLELLTAQVIEEIEDLRVHPSFELIGSKYVADFSYKVFTDDFIAWEFQIVEDVKGVRTALYNLKRKLFLASNLNVVFIEIGRLWKARPQTWRTYKRKLK